MSARHDPGRRGAAPAAFAGDPADAGHAGIIAIASWTYLGSAVAAIVGSLAGRTMSAQVVIIQILAIGAGIAFVWMVRRGHAHTAATGMILTCWAAVTGVLASLGTIRAPALGFYLLVVNLAGMLWGRRGFAAALGLCSATVAALVGAQDAGLLAAVDHRVNVTQWVSATALFIAVGLMTHQVLQLMNGALDRVENEIRERLRAEEVLARRNDELQSTLRQARALERLLPICPGCRRIRENDGRWEAFESFVTAHTGAQFSHGICPDCRREYFPEYPVR